MYCQMLDRSNVHVNTCDKRPNIRKTHVKLVKIFCQIDIDQMSNDNTKMLIRHKPIVNLTHKKCKSDQMTM